MMIHMTTVGGVTADIEGKESANGATYLSFDLAVTRATAQAGTQYIYRYGPFVRLLNGL